MMSLMSKPKAKPNSIYFTYQILMSAGLFNVDIKSNNSLNLHDSCSLSNLQTSWETSKIGEIECIIEIDVMK